GFDQHQLDFGLRLARKAIQEIHKAETQLGNASLRPGIARMSIYHIAEYYRPPVKRTALLAGWTNFANITKGEVVGHLHQKTITAPLAGKIIFPKYGVNAATSSELFGVIQPVRADQIPWE